MKLDYKNTFLIGLGFFTVGIIWNIYNIAVPIYLGELGLSGLIVGIVMAMDNIFAVIFQPVFGALSDKTNTRYGRRMPYLLIGIPLSAVFFLLIPFSKLSVVVLMLVLIFMNFSMSIYRAPTVALMPDLTPSPLRSKANGIINFMGGIGTAAAFLLGGLLFDMKEYYPFAAGSLILVVTIIIMYNFVHEPENTQDLKSQAQKGSTSKEGVKEQRLSLIFLLLAIFFWFTSYNCVETFFSTYGKEVLGITKSTSSFLLMIVSVTFLIVCIPSGFLAGKIGRKRTILFGLILFLACFISLIFVRTPAYMSPILGLAGIGWALININSYPMVVEMSNSNGIGRYTGYYYFASMLASIISPILFGFIKDILGDGFLFIYSSIGIIISIFFMMLVKHGEVAPSNKVGFEALEHMDE